MTYIDRVCACVSARASTVADCGKKYHELVYLPVSQTDPHQLQEDTSTVRCDLSYIYWCGSYIINGPSSTVTCMGHKPHHIPGDLVHGQCNCIQRLVLLHAPKLNTKKTITHCKRKLAHDCEQAKC